MKDLEFKIKDNSTGVITTLISDPDGWSEELINYERQIKYWGIFINFSIPLKFKKDGADLLRSKYYTKGISADCSLQIYKRNIYTNLFELQYTGRIDFTQVNDDRKIDLFEVVLISGGLSSEIANKENVKYEFGLNSFDLPQNSQLKYYGLVNNYETVNQIATTFDIDSAYQYDPKIFIEMGANNFRDINGGYLSFSSYITILKACTLTLDVIMCTRSLRLHDVHVLDPSGWDTIVLKEKIILTRSGVDTDLLTMSTTTVSVNDGYDHTWSMPYVHDTLDKYDFIPGDIISMYVTSEMTLNSVNRIRYAVNESDISWNVRIYAPLPENILPCMSVKSLFEDIGLRLGYPVKSDLLDACPLMLTTGGSTVAKFLYLKTSLSDFFQFVNSVISPAGMGVEFISGVETLVLEERTHFLNGSLTPISLTEISNVKIETASDLIPNVIKVGFPDQSYGDEYGYQEFMQTLELKAPQELLTNELNLVSPYRMDNSGLDYIYYQAIKDGYGTTEYKIDNWADDDIFSLHCKFHSTVGNITYYELDRSGIVITDTTFDNPSEAFNLFYTPKRNFLKHGNFLSGALKFFETQNITTTKTGKYPYLRTQATAQPEITEVSNTLISTLSAPYFVPMYLTLMAPVTDAFETSFLLTPGAPIKFEIDNEFFYGFLMSISKRFAGTKESEFRFLLTSANDLKKLI